MVINNYQLRRLVKFTLLLTAFAIGFFSLWYTNSLVKKLEVQERQKIQNWASATRLLVENPPENTDLIFELIEQNSTIPVILTDGDGMVTAHRNLPNEVDLSLRDLQQLLARMKAENEPISLEFAEGKVITIYYQNSSTLKQLRIYPYFQIGIIGIFLAVSYFAFSYSRRSDQNKVWAGMSKETAHQLGTPISSLIAWVDYAEEHGGNLSPSILEELKKDLGRLELITERFSKIGSEPVLERQDLHEVLNSSIEYINSRTSERVKIGLRNPEDMKGVYVAVNVPLFAWVIENLCKNAVDAMNGEGDISFERVPHSSKLIIDVHDTGKGIPSSQHQNIFKPGYTTKKRGWGLGLSLVKRIVENYHRGKIFVKHSEMGKGTTFRIELRPER